MLQLKLNILKRKKERIFRKPGSFRHRLQLTKKSQNQNLQKKMISEIRYKLRRKDLIMNRVSQLIEKGKIFLCHLEIHSRRLNQDKGSKISVLT